MARAKKDSKALNVNLDVEISNQLTEFCNNTGFTKTVVVEKSIDKFIKDYYKAHPEEKKNYPNR